MLVNGPFEGLLPFALSPGLSITVPQVQTIYAALKIAPLTLWEGSGAKGNVIKRDLVIQIVKKVFGDSVSQDEFWQIVISQHQNTPKCSRRRNLHLQKNRVSCLDQYNCQKFKEVAKDAGCEVAHKELKATSAEELKKTREKVEILERAAAGPPLEPTSGSGVPHPGLGEHAVL